MDFYGITPSLSMNGSSSIATIQNDIDTINNTAVFKAGTQTITGDKTLQGTTTITGDVIANGLTISPTELGYLDGTTSNIQTQINTKADDNTVVHLAGTETITGDKTLQGTTTITGNVIANGLTISPTELGYLDGTTSNIQNQINTKANDNAVVHLAGTETITGTKTFSVNPISATVPTTNSELANKKYVDDTIVAGAFVDIAGTQTITGAKTFTSLLYCTSGSSLQATTQNNDLLTTSGKNRLLVNGAVKIETTSTDNTINNTTSNKIQIGGTDRITMTSTTNTINNTTSNLLQVNSTSKITTTSTENTLENTTNRIKDGTNEYFVSTSSQTTIGNPIRNSIQIAGTEKIACSSANNVLDNSTGNYLRIGGVDKITTTSTSNTFNNTTSNLLQIGGTTKISTTSTDNVLDNSTANYLRIGGTNKIYTTPSSNLINNTNNTIEATNTNFLNATSGFNKLTVTTGTNYLYADGTNGWNLLEAIGSGGKNWIVSDENSFGTVASSGQHIFYIKNAGSQTTKLTINNTILQTEIPIQVRSSNYLLSFQIGGTKRGLNASGVIYLVPNYDLTTTHITTNYALPQKIRFVKATIMFDNDDTNAGTVMTLDFHRKTSNTSTRTLLHSMNFTAVTNTSGSYSQVIDLTGGTAVEYDTGQIFSCDYSGSVGNEWGIVFHGYQL